MAFFKIFISGRYHKDMKILKILASNSKWIRFYGIFEKWQIGTWCTPADIFLVNVSLKQPLVLKIHLDMFFDSRNSKILLVLSYTQILSKFTMQYVSVKKRCSIIADIIDLGWPHHKNKKIKQ